MGGLVPFTATDYPGKLAAVVFCQGCPWRCPYCHNPHLLPLRGENEASWWEIARFLESREGLLDAVVFSGGEPTLHPGLPDVVRDTKALGFAVGLHTAGIYPAKFERLLPWLDWVGFDVKGPFEAYEAVTRVSGSGARALASLRLLLASGTAHEVRTTVHPALLSETDLLKLAHRLARMGVRHYALQAFRAQGCADPALARAGAGFWPSPALLQTIGRQFDTFVVREA